MYINVFNMQTTLASFDMLVHIWEINDPPGIAVCCRVLQCAAVVLHCAACYTLVHTLRSNAVLAIPAASICASHQILTPLGISYLKCNMNHFRMRMT